jgi:signal peptidase II
MSESEQSNNQQQSDPTEQNMDHTVDQESMKNTWQQPTFWLFLGSVISVWLDQWSKAWAASTLYTGNAAAAGGVPINPAELQTKVIEVTSWFNYRLVGNKGAAWGIFKDLPETMRVPFFVVLSAIALSVLLVVYYKSPGQKLMQTALVLICGGAIGNLIDRLQIGYVIDFIDWHIGVHHWPTFNIADVSISIGVGLMVIDMIRQMIHEYQAAKEAKIETV